MLISRALVVLSTVGGGGLDVAEPELGSRRKGVGSLVDGSAAAAPVVAVVYVDIVKSLRIDWDKLY